MPNTSRIIFWLALATTLLSWVLILLGGVVHGTGSSLACPDWPTCQGTFFPEMRGGVLIEHSHRLVAAAVGFLTLILAILCWRRGEAVLKRLSFLAFGLVLFQGILGGVTVLYRLPTAVSTAHLATSMIFLATLVVLTFRSSRFFQREASSRSATARSKAAGIWIFLSLIVVFFQIVLGGMMRHLGAGLACADIPLCQGSLWPRGGSFLLQIHMAHRLFAIVVAFILLGMVWKVARSEVSSRGIRFFLVAIPLLVLGQIGLGLWSIGTALELVPVTAHLGVGALLWVSLILLNFNFQQSRWSGQERVPEEGIPVLATASNPQVS